MSHDPRMSPLYVEPWAKMKDDERDKLVEAMNPKTKLKSGDVLQVQPDGSWVRLDPIDALHLNLAKPPVTDPKKAA